MESVPLYGAEVWRNCGGLKCGGSLGQWKTCKQLRAAKIILGLGRLHPLVSLQFEMDMLPLKWEAIKRVIGFWVKVMRVDDDRLVKVVMLEALKLESKVRWVKDLHQSLERCGWRGLDVRALNGVMARR